MWIIFKNRISEFHSLLQNDHSLDHKVLNKVKGLFKKKIEDMELCQIHCLY